MNTEGSKEQIAYQSAKEKYLAVGKRYSALLKKVMELDPNVLKIAEEIMATGDGLSVHDNTFITNFYKELRNKSKVDKKYYDILLELKKTKNELDHAVSTLSRQRIVYLLRKSGIPPRRVNHDVDILVAHVNNPETTLLEKMCLPGVLDVEDSEGLDELIATEQLVCQGGALVPKTKIARNFIRTLEKGIRQRVNDNYMLGAEKNLLSNFGKIDADNLLDFIRLTADKEHIREIERKIDTGEIKLARGRLNATNEKGEKYLSLLVEELTASLDKKIKTEMLRKNKNYSTTDPRLGTILDAIEDFDITTQKHDRVARLAPNDSVYHTMLSKVSQNKSNIQKAFADLITLQETISVSYAEIKKQILQIINKQQIQVEGVLVLIVAVKYLSVFENKYETKLGEIESMLGLFNASVSTFGPEPVSRIGELYTEQVNVDNIGLNHAVNQIILQRLAGRKKIGENSVNILSKLLLDSPHMREYTATISAQHATRRHIVDSLQKNDCLYQGLGNLSELLRELIELDLERVERLTDINHEIELVHKELWLSKINNSSKEYVDSSFDSLPTDIKVKALGASREAVGGARKEIRDTLTRYRTEHKKHSEEFAKSLKNSMQEVSKGGDVAKISADLKTKYKKLSNHHEQLNLQMENDILMLEKRLINFEKNVPNGLEKILMSDIRQSI